jgi:SAM-dependent methyltransferase
VSNVAGFLEAGANRFAGFADLYEEVRPVPPEQIGVLLARYCGRRPELVVDLGSGTGLSTRWASTWSDNVVGIEPSEDMRRVAEAATREARISYRSGWAHDTGLAAHSADVVIAVQSFHWMEPESTLAEVDRCLRPGGVFAAIDCDWPPVVGDATVEHVWAECHRRIHQVEARIAAGASVDQLRFTVGDGDGQAAVDLGIESRDERQLSEGVRSWSKAGHLQRMEESTRFRWSREIAMGSPDSGNASRFVGLLQSQGDYQSLRRQGLSDVDLGVDRFARVVHERLGSHMWPWDFVFRVRLGFKA